MIGYNAARAYLEAKQAASEVECTEGSTTEQQARALETLTYARMALLDEMLAQVATDIITGRGFHGRVAVIKEGR